MARDFSVPSHTTFFAGYLDAVGRHYTDDSRLCAITAAVMPAEFLEGLAIVSATPVENMVQEFDRDIAKFLNADPRSRLLFYLMDYFDWYKQFSDTCLCEKLRLKGRDLPEDHIAYRLSIDHKHQVLFLGYWKDKEGHGQQSVGAIAGASSMNQGGGSMIGITGLCLTLSERRVAPLPR